MNGSGNAAAAKVRVVKIGGAALADGDWLHAFGRGLRNGGGGWVVVHGGGPDISALSERLGVGVSWSNGRRVTTPEGLDVASMVLSGRLNKRIVAALLDEGVDALGVSGEDGGLVTASVASGGALGRVGQVAAVRGELLRWLIARGVVPVVSPISRDVAGGSLNVNADEVAGAVAAAVGAPELLFVTDVAAVHDGNGVARTELSVSETRELVATGAATGGMAVKLDSALKALDAGVAAVRIGRFEVLNDESAGTRIRAEREVTVCR